ncbi:MAG TPA: hypothetical protein VHV32_04560, partial [Candidatus Angelobacter sp.]|nr:hypothetical protein [Candidatus Angelobacter sp.]
AGKRWSNVLIQRRAHAYSMERIDKAITKSSTPGRTGRNKPIAPSTSKAQPAALNATRFTMTYWMQQREN